MDAPSAGRRMFLAGAMTLVVSPATLWAAVKEGAAARVAPGARAWLEAICDLVIPVTDTPGALAAGVPDFMALAVMHGLNGAAPDVIDLCRAELDAAAGEEFLTLLPERQLQVLAAVDAAAFRDESAPGGSASAWPTIKGLVLMGYYTSKIGAAVELVYLPVPGSYEPDVSLDPGQPGYSNDWWGNAF